MEKERFFGAGWSSTGAPMPPQCLFGLNWEQQKQHQHRQPMSQDAHFESALSSLVSSPTSNHPTGAGDGVVIMELIGRLGSICNSGDVSPTSRLRGTDNASCYSTPLNSPPKINVSMVEQQQNRANGPPMLPNPMPGGYLFAPFAADPAFSERAARYSCFGGRSYGDLATQFGLPEAGKLSRISSSHYLKALGGASELAVPGGDGTEKPAIDSAQLEMEMRSKPGASTPEETELGSGMEESAAAAASDKMVVRDGEASLGIGTESNTRKRKAAPKSKAKEAPLASSTSNQTKTTEGNNSDSKRCKPTETNGPEKDSTGKPKTEQTGDSAHKQGKDSNDKLPEPPKDYIHVRARRGQATDSHSLAERVRREKISERMKFLQDLVPGCNKVTGKAVMLDEIINYVQSLQRQVEFLSMKLATVNPRLEFNMETVLPKEGQLPQPVYPIESAAMQFPFSQQTQGNPLQSIATQRSLGLLESSLQRSLSMQLPSLDAFDTTSQLPSFWEDDLQSVVRMGFGQSQETDLSSQSLEGQMPASHMKIEL